MTGLLKRLGTVLLALAATTAMADVGAKDGYGYRGMDSRSPQPQLDTSLLTLLTPTGVTTITSSPSDDGYYDWNIYTPAGSTYAYPYGNQWSTVRVSSNGYISEDCCEFPFDNRALPDPRERQWVMPFMDDLLPVEGTSTITGHYSTGAWVAVQWNDFALFDNPDARLTFRVTMSVGSSPSWILFQYIKMEGEGADGSSATIGLQHYGNYWNQYAYNQAGAVVTGTATDGEALQAVLFDRDDDSDQLVAYVESLVGSSDSLVDTDAGGVSDPYEYVNSFDPTNPADDPATTDTDGDGLSDLDEGFFGSDPAQADGDSDGLEDDEELFTHSTDPMVADTDGDGVSDGDEVDAGSDPTDVADFPAQDLAVSTDSKHKVRSVRDDGGNIHIIAMNDETEAGLFYYMVTPEGTVRIAESGFKGNQTGVKHPGISFHDGIVYVTYEIVDSAADTATMRLRAIDPSLDDRDGSPASMSAITVFDKALALPGNPRHHDVVAGSTGVHVVYETHADPRPDGNGEPEDVYYARIDTNGDVVATQLLYNFPQLEGTGSDGTVGVHGIHKWHGPRVDLDDQGVAHVVFNAQAAPYYGSLATQPSAMWYAAVGSTLSGPYYLDHGRYERADITYKSGLLYISRSNGYDTNVDEYRAQGIQMAILDPASYSVIPRVGDYFGTQWAVDPGSMPLPFTTVYTNDDNNQGSTVVVNDQGVAFIYFSDDSDNLCVVAALPDGRRLGEARCFFQGDSDKYTRYKSIFVLSDTELGAAFSDWNSELYYGRIPVAVLYDPASVPTVELNRAPLISTTPPSPGAAVGMQWRYAASASDDHTAAGALAWRLENAPVGMDVSDGGEVTWTPNAADWGEHSSTLVVCDDATPSRCRRQAFRVNVGAAMAPVVTSTPSTTAIAGRSYSYTVVATDVDGSIASYALVTPASGPALSAEGALTWTPTVDDIGTHAVVVQVTDDQGNATNHSFSITVIPDVSPLSASGGCSSTGGGSAAGLLLLALGALLGRRRQARV